MSGTVSLPLNTGQVKVGINGVVTLERNRIVYPFAQPQPYYTVSGDTTFTTNGVRLLAQTIGSVTSPLRVRASLDLLCALLISPDGLTLGDLAELVFRRESYTLTLDLPAARLGLAAGSQLVFSVDYQGIEFEVLVTSGEGDTSWGWPEGHTR